ncbi:MAG: hypothetical protein KL787_04240 [Taibaiella sp.]|nr:hypothetical protein [Taibaiella sp.]
MTGILRYTNPDDYHSSPMNIKSPTAAAMERRSAYNIDLYTGALSLQLPLLSTSHASIQVPVTLSYSGSGIKVDEYSGWVGLGWSLQAGGVISRKTNDMADEYYNRSVYLPTGTAGKDAGYYFTGRTLDRTDWSSTAYLRSKLSSVSLNDSMVDMEPDEFVFSFGGYSGSFYRSETGEWKVKSKQNITLEIEEVLDNSGNFKLWYRFHPFNDNDDPWTSSSLFERVASLFTRFTITTPDGFRYIFGGDTTAIEFSRGMIDISNIHTMDKKENYITANAWYLTKIISPQNDTVSFEYKPARALFKKFITRIPQVYDERVGFSSSHYALSGITINQVFLRAIHTPTTRIDFYVNNSTELPLSAATWVDPPPVYSSPDRYLKDQLCLHWNDLRYEEDYIEFPNNMRKLDSIKVYEKQTGKYTNGIKLYYKQNTTQRKTLDSVLFYDFEHAVKGELYKFEYNNISLFPPYESPG